MVRPDGIRRDLTLLGRGRDILTDIDGSVELLDRASMDVVIDFLDAVDGDRDTNRPEGPRAARDHRAGRGDRFSVSRR